MTAPLTRTVEVLARVDGAVDAYNNPAHSYPVAGQGTTHLGEIQQASAEEMTVDRDGTSTEWLLWLPADAALTAVDRVHVDGTTYEVVGEPERVWHPWAARVDHVAARLKVVTG